jgi:hypothetical protein
MEYPNGGPLGPWWTDWTGTGPQILLSTNQSRSGIKSGYVNDDPATGVDAILDLGAQTSGEWGLAFYMYIPNGKEGYWNLQAEPVGTQFIVGNIYFNQDGLNPEVGTISNSALGVVDFDFPHDEWFRVVMNFDLTNGMALATWQFGVNGVEAIPEGTPLTNFNGVPANNLGGVNFYALATNNELYLDDFEYAGFFLDLFLGVNDNELSKFSVSPNPVQENLNISTQSDIKSSRIYSLQGILVSEDTSSSSIDVSQLAAGIYFIQLTTDAGKSVQKFIKN